MLAYQKQNALKFILMNVDNCTEWKWNQLLICILEEQVQTKVKSADYFREKVQDSYTATIETLNLKQDDKSLHNMQFSQELGGTSISLK